MHHPPKILLIQTAFLGDVILATAAIESILIELPQAEIHFLLRKGNESVLQNHPKLKKVWVYDKRRKLADSWRLVQAFRKERFDFVFNFHRFFSSGIITVLSNAGFTAGFTKNPLSGLFSKMVEHTLTFPLKMNGKYLHEIERNHQVVETWRKFNLAKPKLYPSDSDREKVRDWKGKRFITMAPGSVWPTKRLPIVKWVELIEKFPGEYEIVLLGSPTEKELCEEIYNLTKKRGGVHNLAGSLSILQSAVLQSYAENNYVNDSGPLHMASAMDAAVTAFFLSTVPEFGFGPLSSQSNIIQVKENLECRPCGIHGFKACPKQHFRCAFNIQLDSELSKITENLTY